MTTSIKKAGYTPGPLEAHGRDIGKLSGTGDFAVIAVTTAVGSNPEANAKLLSKAPEMAEALLEIRDPLYAWANEKGIGHVEYRRRSEIVDRIGSLLREAGVIE